jgi:hypothetical protein
MYLKIRKSLGLVLVLVLSVLALPSAGAQTVYGSLRGLAKDTQGAIVPDASVVLTNQDTKVSRTSVTNSAGEFTFTAVDPGAYAVSITMSGFKKAEERDITVSTGATASVDFTLQVGGATETVEVSAAAPLIDTANASNGAQFSSQQLEDLPNLGRNPFVFEKLDNNVVPTGDPRFVRAEDQGGSASIAVAGAPIGANSYSADGIPTSTSSGGLTFIPSIESVSDTKIQANTYDAEVGRTGGGNFNATLKSGTSTYHGVLYGETRQTPWSANTYADKESTSYYDSKGVLHQGVTPRPDITTYLYAGAFGGPLPYSSKYKYLNNTFFWVTEEGYRQAQPYSGGNSTFESAGTTKAPCASVVGASSALCIYDPTTAPVRKLLTSTDQRTNGVPKFNVIPLSELNPIGISILNAYPSATQTGSYGAANFFGSDDFKTRADEYSGKVDHVFAPWWSAAASYVHLATQEPGGNILHTVIANEVRYLRFNDATAFNNVFTVNPTTVVTVGYGFNRYFNFTPQYSNGFNLTSGFAQPTSTFASDPYTGTYGFPSSYANLISSKTFPGVSFTIPTGSTFSSSGGGANGSPAVNSSHNFVIGVSKTIGKQQLKAGYVYRLMQLHTLPVGSQSFTFTGQYTSLDGNTASSDGSNGGSGYADDLVGNPATATLSVNNTITNMQAMYHALYVQDDFRFNDKITINIGLRYEYELGGKESNNNYAVGFDPTIAYTFHSAAAPMAHGGLVFAGVHGIPERCCEQSHTKFAPRLGVAYEVRPGTVVRAGFGVFYAPTGLAANIPGYSQTSSYQPATAVSAPVSVGTAAYLSNPFSGGAAVLQPSGNSLAYLTGLGGSISVPDLHRKFPYVEQYSVDVQHQLPYGISLKVGYVGAHSQKFPLSINIDQIPDTLLSQYAWTTKLAAKVTNPYYAPTVGGYPASGTINTTQITLAQSLLPYPQFTSVNLSESVGYSLYNSLDLKAEKRMAKGLTVVGTFTWASNWDDLFSSSSTLGTNDGPQDNYNIKGEYARAVQDVPKRTTIALTYELPVGRGRKYLSSAPRIVDELVGGWQINDEIIKQDGSPLAIQQTNLNSSTALGGNGFGGSVQRPNLVAGVSACKSGGPGPRLPLSAAQAALNNTNYFNGGAFAPSSTGTYGNTPRTIGCYGPGYSNMDLSVNKTFSITERLKVQFRAEALNATNTPEFGPPTTTLNVSTSSPSPTGFSNNSYGLSSGTLGFSRIIQMGGRITF